MSRGRLYAIRKAFLQEVEVWSTLDHPNVCQVGPATEDTWSPWNNRGGRVSLCFRTWWGAVCGGFCGEARGVQPAGGEQHRDRIYGSEHPWP